ncbi:MAG: LacI family DNA-binding transcriptional regulator [Dermatophilaceae bacterium]
MGRVTLRTVAERANVSMTTVSHVLNDVAGKRINQATRERVVAAAADLGYVPNRLAQGLRLRRSSTLGFISDQIATSPHAGRTILGAQDAAAEHEMLLMLMNSENDSELEAKEIDALIERQVDGIIYAAEHHVVLDPPDALRTVPNVLLGARTIREGFAWVVPDEIGGTRAAMAELLDRGHRHIGFVQCSLDLPATDLRLAGYREALEAAEITYQPSFVIADTTDGPGGFRAARSLLDRPREERPTALFCFNDRMAMGAYQATAELGLEVGSDVSIIGFDNQEIIAANLRPGLTTVELPHYEMGRWAVDTLVGAITRRGEETTTTALMPCPLIARASVGAPPRP